jgi:hypothetical protein
MVMSSSPVGFGRPRPWRVGLRQAATATVVVGTLLVTGCSITAKRNEARLITTAHKKLVQSGTALLSVTVQEKIIAVPGGFASQTASGPVHAGQSRPPTTTTVVTNFPLREALVVPSSGATAKPTNAAQYFQDGVIYQRLPNAATSSRPWLQLDFAALYSARKSNAGVGYGHDLLNPLWVVDLLKGTLTGSVTRVGTTPVGGVLTTEYAVNFAWDKSLRGATDTHTRAVQAALTLLGVPGSVVKGRVWLDGQGVVRQMQATIRERRSRHEQVAWQYTIRFAAIGQAVTIALPKSSQVARVDAVAPVANAASAQSSTVAPS